MDVMNITLNTTDLVINIKKIKGREGDPENAVVLAVSVDGYITDDTLVDADGSCEISLLPEDD